MPIIKQCTHEWWTKLVGSLSLWSLSSMVVSTFIALRQAKVSITGLDVPLRFKECVPHTETYHAQQELGIQNKTKGLLLVPNMSRHQISRIWVLGQNTQWGFQVHLLPSHSQLQWIDRLPAQLPRHTACIVSSIFSPEKTLPPLLSGSWYLLSLLQTASGL